MPEGVRLADSDLWLVPEGDDCGGPDRILPGFGNTMRDGLGVRAERGGVEIAVIGGLVLDPVLGVRRTSLKVSNLSSFGEDAQGRVYVASLDGPVYRIVPR